ncbi:GTP cyclohydrolase II [Qipengyuania thermophila]|uniref:GTP cyclohydrolase II n=1 Tax=Qipengyuania thermophila TaxID=2509361 RepID=UPI001F010ED8|nr:GTP cyclohydrolase II [Qipengyuania thermophila]
MTGPGAPSARRAAQAIDAVRHGWPVRLGGGPQLLPVETASAPAVKAPTLLLSAGRAVTLKLANQKEAADPRQPVLIRGAEPFDLASARSVADPARDLLDPLRGPFRAMPLDWPDEAVAALELARRAGVLPAFLVAPEPGDEPVCASLADLDAWSDPQRLLIATRARLPLARAAEAELLVFRKPDDLREHAALIVGRQSADTVPLVRLHSECLTGDVFGSLKCDCGPQLDHALDRMAAEADEGRWGILLYLRQEGRGIGLVNKLRAYRLQDQGFDTVDANERLGLPDESRDFATAAAMLRLMEVRAVRLLTNNPAKVAALTEAGITVEERVPHQTGSNAHNLRYLRTKRDRAGHLLG